MDGVLDSAVAAGAEISIVIGASLSAASASGARRHGVGELVVDLANTSYVAALEAELVFQAVAAGALGLGGLVVLGGKLRVPRISGVRVHGRMLKPRSSWVTVMEPEVDVFHPHVREPRAPSTNRLPPGGRRDVSDMAAEASPIR